MYITTRTMNKSIRPIVLLTLCLFSFLFTQSKSVAQNYVYQRSIGNPLGQLVSPSGIAKDSEGNIYVAERQRGVVFKYRSDGTPISEFGRYGFNGDIDDLYDPRSICVDVEGNIYIVEYAGQRVKKFNRNGEFVLRIGDQQSSDIGKFNQANGVAIDADGFLYVADTGNHRIQKFRNDGVYVTSWGGFGTNNGKFNYPDGLCVTSSGLVAVADRGNNRIQIFDKQGAFVQSITNNLNSPLGVTSDSRNRIFVTDQNNKLFCFDETGQLLSSTDGTESGAGQSRLQNPTQLVCSNDNRVYVSDSGNRRIAVFDSSNSVSLLQLKGFGAAGSSLGSLYLPHSVTVDTDGTVYVSDHGTGYISVFGNDGLFKYRFGGPDILANPQGLAISSLTVVIANTGANNLKVFSKSGAFLKTIGSSGTQAGQFQSPSDVSLDSDGNIYVADQGNNRVQKFDLNGNFVSKWDDFNVAGIATVGSLIYTVSRQNGTGSVYDSSGVFLRSFGRYGFNGDTNDLYDPRSISVDVDGNIYIVEYAGQRVKKYNRNGEFVQRIGDQQSSDIGKFNQANGVYVTANGDLFVADMGNNRVQVFRPDGRPVPVTTLTQSPVRPSSGWNATSVDVTLSATDGAGGNDVKEIHYSINMGTEQVVAGNKATFTLSSDGTHSISYWTIDNLGLVEPIRLGTVKIDRVSPSTVAVLDSDRLSLFASDAHSGLFTSRLTIDGGTVRDYAGPVTLTTGAHIISYWSVDNAGNVEPERQLLVGLSLQILTLDKVTAIGGNDRTAIVKLSTPAPAGGIRVNLVADKADVTIPSYVDIPAGTSSASFVINTRAVATQTSIVISAFVGTQSKSAQLDLIPPSARISATPRSVVGGAVVTFAVTLDGPAPAGGTVVSLSSDNADVLPVPATVTIAEGQLTASVQVTSVPTQDRSTVIVSASTAAQSAMATVLVDAPSPVSVSLTPTSVNGGAGSVGSVTINGTAPVGGYEVSLASNSAAATVPASLVIPAGQTTGSFDISTRGVQQNTTVNITATANNVRRVAVLTVRSAAVASVQVTPSTVLGSQSAVGRVNLTTPAPDGGLVVDLTSSNTNVIVPTTVRIAAGETFATFDLQTKSVIAQAVATITATFNGASRTTTLTVNALVLQNLSVSSSTVIGGNGLTATVTLSAPAPTGGVSVALSSNNAAVSVLTTFTVAAGQITATVDITTVAVTINTNVTLTATLLGVSKTSTVTVTAPGLTRLMLNPSSVVGGNTTTATVDIGSPAPAGGLVIALSSNRSDVLAPATVTVPAGQTSLSVQIPTKTVLSQVDAVITATLNGVSRTANLSLTAPVLTSIALNPSTIRGGEDATLTVQLTSVAPTGGVTVVLASTNAALVVPSTVTVPGGETTVKVTLSSRAVNETVNGLLSASFAGVTKSVQVSVLAPVMASLTIEPNAVVGGSSATGTLELTSVAPSGGLVVSLASNKADVVVPTTVTIPAGSTTVSFAVQTSKVSSDVTASVTATLNGNTRTTQVRVVSHQLATLAVTPSSVSGGTSFTGRVTLQQAAPAGGIVVSLASSDPAISLPVNLTIDAGKTTATFAGTTVAVTATKNVTITASLNGNSVTDTLRVVQPGVKSISLSPSTVTGGTGSQLTITLDAPAPADGWVVNLASSDASATIATTAMVAAGQTTVTVPVSTKSVLTRTAVTLTATDASGSQSTTLVVEPVVGLQLRLSSSSIAGGNSVNLTVELAEAAPKTGATVALSADNAALVVPVSIKVLAGSKTATIAVKSLAVATDTTVRIAGTVNGFTDRAQLVVTAPRPQAVTFTPSAILGGKPSTGTLTLTGLAPVGGLTVQLSSDNAAATVPATVLVPAGKNVATFVVTTKAVTGRTLVNISASANGTTVSQQLAVQALTVQSVVLKPGTVVGGTPSVGTVTLNGVAPAGGLQVDLTSSVNGVTVPAKVFVPAGKNIVTFTATTEPVGSNVEATLTARANGDQAAATLLVTPVLVSSLTVAPTTVVGGTSATGTVKLTVAPGVDTVVTLSSANPAIASVAALVIVKKGSLTATFTVTTKKPAAQTAVTLSAVTGGAAKTGTLTVKP